MENTRRTLRSYVIVFVIIAVIASIVAIIRAGQEPKATTVAVAGRSNPVSQFNEDGSHKILNHWINRKYKEGYNHLETEHSISNDTVFVHTIFNANGVQKEANGIFTSKGRMIKVNVD